MKAIKKGLRGKAFSGILAKVQARRNTSVRSVVFNLGSADDLKGTARAKASAKVLSFIENSAVF